jgi:hypothetical protein
MTDTVTSLNIDVSSLDIPYMYETVILKQQYV